MGDIISSKPEDRLFAIKNAYMIARANRNRDLQEATTEAQVNRILDNIDKLEARYYQAATAALDANGEAVEAAYAAAVKATSKVEAAYLQAKSLASRIKLVTKMVEVTVKLFAALA